MEHMMWLGWCAFVCARMRSDAINISLLEVEWCTLSMTKFDDEYKTENKTIPNKMYCNENKWRKSWAKKRKNKKKGNREIECRVNKKCITTKTTEMWNVKWRTHQLLWKMHQQKWGETKQDTNERKKKKVIQKDSDNTAYSDTFFILSDAQHIWGDSKWMPTSILHLPEMPKIEWKSSQNQKDGKENKQQAS